MTFSQRLTAFCLVLLIGAPSTLLAEDGHDHGEAPAAPTGPALPRFSAVSETFELVGVLDETHLTLYLDHAADNSPVQGATLELEVGGIKVDVEQHGEGEFEAILEEEPEEGEIAVTATVVAGQEMDVLAGELDIHHDEHGHESTQGPAWAKYGAWGVGGLVLLALLGWAVRRARITPRKP